MVKFAHNGEHHAFSKVFFFWCIYLMPCFQSDLSSRLPETADDTVPQKVKKQIHWLKECQINTTSFVSPACWAILTRLLHLAFNLLFQYVFPGLKMLFSVFTFRGLHCALLSLHLNTTFCSSSLLCCTLTGCVGLCCHCSHCVQSCGLGSELMVYKKCLVMGNRIGGKHLLGKWMFILKRVCWAGFSFPFLIMGWKIHFLLAPQSIFFPSSLNFY